MFFFYIVLVVWLQYVQYKYRQLHFIGCIFFLVLLTHSHTYMFSITFSPLFCLSLLCSWAFVWEGSEMRVLEVERLIGPQKGLKLMSYYGV